MVSKSSGGKISCDINVEVKMNLLRIVYFLQDYFIFLFHTKSDEDTSSNTNSVFNSLPRTNHYTFTIFQKFSIKLGRIPDQIGYFQTSITVIL